MTERSPSRRRALLVVLTWAWQTLVALLAGAVVATRVGAVYGQHPDADAALWREGGLELLDLVVRARGELSTLATAVAAILGLGTLIGVWPYALLLHDARTGARARRPRLVDLARDAVPSLPTLVALRLLFLAGAVLIVVAAYFALHLGQAVGASGGNASDARIDVTGWVFGLAVLAALVPWDIAIDAAGAATVDARRPRLAPALIRACEVVGAAPRKLAFAWAWRMVAGLVLVAAGAMAASKLGGHGGAELVGLAVAHQLVSLGRTALRASWLSVVVRRTEAPRGPY